jgi:hypothetical protein
MIRLLIKIKNLLENYIKKHSKFMCDKCNYGEYIRAGNIQGYKCLGVHAWIPSHKCPNFTEDKRVPIRGTLVT